MQSVKINKKETIEKINQIKKFIKLFSINQQYCFRSLIYTLVNDNTLEICENNEYLKAILYIKKINFVIILNKITGEYTSHFDNIDNVEIEVKCNDCIKYFVEEILGDHIFVSCFSNISCNWTQKIFVISSLISEYVCCENIDIKGNNIDFDKINQKLNYKILKINGITIKRK